METVMCSKQQQAAADLEQQKGSLASLPLLSSILGSASCRFRALQTPRAGRVGSSVGVCRKQRAAVGARFALHSLHSLQDTPPPPPPFSAQLTPQHTQTQKTPPTTTAGAEAVTS